MSKHALLIPIYEPDGSSLVFLRTFKQGDFDRFLVIDDGSGERFKAIFDEIAATTVFEVIGYPVNKGKGFALKHGFARLLEKDPDLDYVITADGDGQHAYEDILRVKESAIEHPGCVIMGNRVFDKKSVPIASKIGHFLASISFKGVSRQKIDDVQTGLRGIPSALFPLALETPGNRYDYEHDFLLEASKVADIVSVDIKAIYIDNNRGSHFHPIRDTLIIHKHVLLYILASVGSWGIDLGLFYLFSTYVFTGNAEQQVFISTLLARIISGFGNFLLLFFFVFDRRRGFAQKLGKYATLFVINLCLSGGLTYAFKFLPAALTFIKFVVDAVISIVNYFINRIWVFASKKRKHVQTVEGGDK